MLNLIDIGTGRNTETRCPAPYNNLACRHTVSTAEQGIYTKLCKGHEALCERFGGKAYNGTSIDNAVSQMQAAAADKFYEKTGYPPDIRSKEDFINNQKTQDEIRTHVEQKLQEQIAG